MIHHLYANRSNVGDWLAAQGIQQLLGRPVTEHLGDTPFVAETRARLLEASEGDVLVIGGGGLFMDYFDPLWSALDAVAGRFRVAIWGAGSKGVAFLTTLGVRSEVAFAVDINPHKHGFFMPGTGHEVVGPERLREAPPDVVVVMNPIYVEEIRRQDR